jgi:ubiquinone/menaquinone biosynthesis C-methylase UbiE
MKTTLGPADLYDLRTRTIHSDGRLVSSFARGYSALEVGCGTGRITEWLVGQGSAQIIGIDINEERLAVARRKPALSQAAELKLIHGDFLTFDWPAPFERVLFAFNVLAEFPTVPARIAAIRRSCELLRSNGRILVITHMHDFTDFAKARVSYTFNLSSSEGEWEGSLQCTRSPVDQLSSCSIVYRNLQTHRTIQDSWISSLITRNELLAIFQAAGAEVEHEYGDYTLGTLTNESKVLVHVLKRAPNE